MSRDIDDSNSRPLINKILSEQPGKTFLPLVKMYTLEKLFEKNIQKSAASQKLEGKKIAVRGSKKLQVILYFSSGEFGLKIRFLQMII